MPARSAAAGRFSSWALAGGLLGLAAGTWPLAAPIGAPTGSAAAGRLSSRWALADGLLAEPTGTWLLAATGRLSSWAPAGGLPAELLLSNELLLELLLVLLDLLVDAAAALASSFCAVVSSISAARKAA